MADATNIDTLQAQRAQQQEEAVRTQALQRVLEAFAAGTLQSPVAYRVLLQRVHTLLTEALASTPVPDPLPPTSPREEPPPTTPPEAETEDVQEPKTEKDTP